MSAQVVTLMPDTVTEQLRVAIIGAGAAGLVACHRLLDTHPGRFIVNVYEQADAVGGTWVYTEETGSDVNGRPIHSSMYDNLRTNIPKELMTYLDFPFPPGGSSYIGRHEVLQYLNDYCDAFDVRKHIQLLTRVVTVEPLDVGHPNHNWDVETENVVTGQRTKSNYHAVLICTGNYSFPKYPEFPDPGLSVFKGRVLHSHDYRKPDIFAGNNVLVLGAGSSGVDIALEAAKTAKQVYLSHAKPDPFVSPFPANLSETTWISQCLPDGFRLTDGTLVQVDLLVVCTGYEYSFPFVTPSCGLTVQNHRVSPLYKHLFHCHHPTLSLLSVPFTTVPFVVADCQAQLVVATLLDPTLLPSSDEMLADTERERQSRLASGEPARHFHKFGFRIWPHLDELMRMAGLPLISPARDRLYRLCYRDRSANLNTYREFNYDMIDDDAVYR